MGSSKKDRDGILDLDVLINDVIKSGVDPSYFDLDISLPRAPNVIEFALSSTYLNTVLWAKQAEQAVKLFAEWCPHCSDPAFIQDVPVDAKMDEFRDRVMLLDKGVCPKCGQNRGDLFSDFPYELVSCLGQRSGKTALNGGVITPYIMHRLLMIPNPARYYGLMSNTFLYMTFVAITADQAKQTLWIAFKGSLASSPWFQAYNKALEAQEKEKGLRRGTLLKVMDTYVWYGNKRISASYEAASTARSLRGRTRLSSSIDELGWFNANSTALQANASETYTALSNSLRTVRSAADILWDNGDYDVLSAYMLNIGSPSSQYDKIMSLLKDCEVDTRKVGFHWSSWESSPLITRKSLKSEELTDPNAFWRDYGAIPPLANSPFISNDKALYTCQTTDEPLFKTKPVYVEDKAGDGKFIAASLVSCSKDKQTARIVTCDAGEKGNHFCIALHHIKPSDKNVVQIYLDGIVEVAPEHNIEKNEITSIHFPTMFNIVMELCKNFNILVVAYDRWSSTGEIQRLRDFKVVAERYSPKWQDFIDFRNVVYSENYKMPRWEHKNLTDLDLTDHQAVSKAPYTHAAVQMATVREVGKKVTKPEYGEDDTFRATVLATRYLLDEKWQKKFLQAGFGNIRRQRGQLGSVRMKSTALGGSLGSPTAGTSSVAAARFNSQRR